MEAAFVLLHLFMVITPTYFFESSEQLAAHLLEKIEARKVFVLTDENVHQHCLSRLLESFETEPEIEIIEVEAGETSKSIQIYEHICEHLAECGAGKDDLLLCLGGGMITDLGGFIGSTFKRGMNFIHIPTSLLGMVDAANGGKNGINLGVVKNAIGTIKSPTEILIYPGFIETLPDVELQSGFAEMIKHGIIAGNEYWQRISEVNQISSASVAPLIEGAVSIKDSITAIDPFESGPRKKLNFGHSIGHAIESHFLAINQIMSHGQAVAFGMICEIMIAQQMSLIDQEEAKRILQLILTWYHPEQFDLPEYDQIKGYLSQDKKNNGKELRMSLPTAIGHIEYNISVGSETAKSCYEHLTKYNRTDQTSTIDYLVNTI